MRAKTIETLAWVLIYSGLLLLCVGWFVLRTNEPVGSTMVAVGAGDAAVGAFLIWWRSRMNDPS